MAKSMSSRSVEVSAAEETGTPAVLKAGQSGNDTRPGLQNVSDADEQLDESAYLDRRPEGSFARFNR